MPQHRTDTGEHQSSENRLKVSNSITQLEAVLCVLDTMGPSIASAHLSLVIALLRDARDDHENVPND